jgi:hypothetical protein
MLTGFPNELDWNGDAGETVVFDENLGFLTNTILKAGSEPWVNVTRNIYSRCSDEIVPMNISIYAS